MIRKSYLRRNYFVKKGFQIRYTLSIVLMLLLVMFTTGIGLYLGMWASIIENFSDFRVSQDLETAKRITDYEDVRFRKQGDYRLEKIFREAALLSENQRMILKNALESVNKSLLPKVLILAFFIFIGGIFISHKLAGPMYRFEQSAKAVSQGDLSVRFGVRKGDEMKKAALSLEYMTETLRKDIERIKNLNNELKEKVNKLSSSSSNKEIEHIKEIVDYIDNLLSRYKT